MQNKNILILRIEAFEHSFIIERNINRKIEKMKGDHNVFLFFLQNILLKTTWT